MTEPMTGAAGRSALPDGGEHTENASADVAPELFERATEDGRR
ncbi:MAG: hypothetical protein ACOC06_07790 [Halorubrum sp.]